MKFTITYAPIVLLLSLGVQSCGGAEDAGLTGENTDPEGGGASNGGGANAGGTSGGGNSNGGGTNTGGAGDASGGGSAGTGGASDGTEDCLNGRDDDGDGDVDCADDDCVAVSCVAEAPEGWSGPIAFRDVDNAAADGLVCPDSFPAVAFEAGGDLDVEPATCSACECEVTADQCQAQLLSFGGSCGNNAQSDPVQSECTALGLGQFGFDAAYVGGCSVGNSQPALPTAEWGSRSIGCEATALGGGCAERSTCAPELSADTRLCVYREGDASCTDQYPAKFLRYRELRDDRCAACCGSFSTPWTCELQVTRHNDSSCSEAGTSESSACDLRVPGYYYAAKATAPERASCWAQSVGGVEVGSIDGEGPLTICCVE